MILGNVQLHNVHETLAGSSAEVLGDEMIEWFRQRGELRRHAAHRADGPGGLWLCRFPDAARRSLSRQVKINALNTTGCEIRFNLRSDEAVIELKCFGGEGIVEIYQGSFPAGWQAVGEHSTRITVRRPRRADWLDQVTREQRLPFDAGLTRVILPYIPEMKLLKIEGDFELPRPEQVPATRWLAYGSSITHGRIAVRPTETYAMQTAQRLGVDLINLGVAGGARFEPVVAEFIASRRDWQFALLEIGANLIGGIDAAEFERRIEAFLRIILDRHPDQPVFCTDLPACYIDVENPSLIAAFRKIVRQVVRRFPPNVVHVPAARILPSAAGLTADLLHPSPQGATEMALRLAKILRRRLAKSSST